MKKLYSLLILMSVVAISCNEPAPTPTLEDKLVSKPWKLYKLDVTVTPATDSSLGLTANIYDMFDLCFADNVMHIAVDRTYYIDEADSVCNVGDDQTLTSGAWEITNSQNSLSFENMEFPELVLDDDLTVTYEEQDFEIIGNIGVNMHLKQVRLMDPPVDYQGVMISKMTFDYYFTTDF